MYSLFWSLTSEWLLNKGSYYIFLINFKFDLEFQNKLHFFINNNNNNVQY